MRINWLFRTAQPTPAPIVPTPRGGVETVGLPVSGIPGAVRPFCNASLAVFHFVC